MCLLDNSGNEKRWISIYSGANSLEISKKILGESGQDPEPRHWQWVPGGDGFVLEKPSLPGGDLCTIEM